MRVQIQFYITSYSPLFFLPAKTQPDTNILFNSKKAISQIKYELVVNNFLIINLLNSSANNHNSISGEV